MSKLAFLLTVTALVQQCNSFLIPSLTFGGCNIRATKETEEKTMPKWSTDCEKKVDNMDLTHDDKQVKLCQILFAKETKRIFK